MQEGLTKRTGGKIVTAIGTLLCFHYDLLLMHNMFEGERWGYGMHVLKTLLEAGIKPLAWVYDINCRFSTAVARVRKDGFPIMTPVPGFHINMHNAACRAKNHPDVHVGLGLLRGEPPETLNAWLGRFLQIARYMSHAGRALYLTIVAWRWNTAKSSEWVKLQLQALYRAQRKEVGSGQYFSQLVSSIGLAHLPPMLSLLQIKNGGALRKLISDSDGSAVVAMQRLDGARKHQKSLQALQLASRNKHSRGELYAEWLLYQHISRTIPQTHDTAAKNALQAALDGLAWVTETPSLKTPTYAGLMQAQVDHANSPRWNAPKGDLFMTYITNYFVNRARALAFDFDEAAVESSYYKGKIAVAEEVVIERLREKMESARSKSRNKFRILVDYCKVVYQLATVGIKEIGTSEPFFPSVGINFAFIQNDGIFTYDKVVSGKLFPPLYSFLDIKAADKVPEDLEYLKAHNKMCRALEHRYIVLAEVLNGVGNLFMDCLDLAQLQDTMSRVAAEEAIEGRDPTITPEIARGVQLLAARSYRAKFQVLDQAINTFQDKYTDKKAPLWADVLPVLSLGQNDDETREL